MYNNCGETIIYAPWGRQEVLFRSPKMVFKEIIIKPSESISYQYHNERGEIWYIEKGKGKFTHDDCDTHVQAGDLLTIDIQEKHRIENTGEGNLIIMECQFGICKEDDIVRLEDKYGRT